MADSQHLIRRRRVSRVGIVIVSALAAIGALAGSAAAQPAGPARLPAAASSRVACTVPALQAGLHVSGATVASATMVTGGSYTATGSTSPLTGLPSFCAAALIQPDSAGNPIGIAVWLPARWNGRFEGTGGGGYSCGISYQSLATGIESGYATASTDCGAPGSGALGDSWVVNQNGTLNAALAEDFASVGIHDMSMDGKAVTADYYKSAPKFSYFDGCSTGGREALMEAQRYPADYNGIVSGSPAINWTRFIPSELWPELVMKENNDYLPTCKETAFTDAVAAACATQGGVTSPYIADPARCHWNPATLVGTSTPCGAITATDAKVIREIWDGPTNAVGRRLWYGLEPGASLSGLAGTSTSASGVTTGDPFPISVEWIGTWLEQNPSFDWTTLTHAQFGRLFKQSVAEYSNLIATDNPNLSRFKTDGGKIIIYHGLADQLIFPQGTINYYERVERAMGGARRTDSFARLFLAPGAQHCADAAGPMPDNPLAAVVSWVERGQAPASLPASLTDASGVVTFSRPLCMFPLTASYIGSGSTDVASSFICARQRRGPGGDGRATATLLRSGRAFSRRNIA